LITIGILYFAARPNYLPAEQVQEALEEEGASAKIRYVQVVDGAEETAIHFRGSPTVHIDGVDVEPSARSDGELRGFAAARTAARIAPKVHRALRLSGRPFVTSATLENIAAVSRIATKPGDKVRFLPGAAALVSAVAASSCCLPLLPFVAAGLCRRGGVVYSRAALSADEFPPLHWVCFFSVAPRETT
jgi:hypothetical protein